MPSKRYVAALTTLIALGILCGVLWRAEVEWHGWAGLTWLTYFHWALPIGATLFLAWTAVFVQVSPTRKKLLFLAAVVAIMLLTYVVVVRALHWRFVGGPGAFVALGSLNFDTDRYRLYRGAILAIYPLVPIVAWIVVRLFGAQRSVYRLIASVSVVLAAFPTAQALLGYFHHRGGSDAIHTIKSGFIIPLLVIGIGLLIIPARNPPTDAKGSWTR